MRAWPSVPWPEADTTTGPPVRSACAIPEPLTATVVASALFHVTDGKASWLPSHENAVAASCIDSPSTTVAVPGATSIRDTSVAAMGSQSLPPLPPHPANRSEPSTRPQPIRVPTNIFTSLPLTT